MSAPSRTHVMLSKVVPADFADVAAQRVVRDRDLEGFKVTRESHERWIVENRTAWIGGCRVVRSFSEMQSLIAKA